MGLFDFFRGMVTLDPVLTLLLLLGLLFVVCAISPKVRGKVFGMIDHVLGGLLPAKGPTADEIAEAIEARRKAAG